MRTRYTVIPATKNNPPRIIELTERRAPKYRDALPLPLPFLPDPQLTLTVFSKLTLAELANTHTSPAIDEYLRAMHAESEYSAT